MGNNGIRMIRNVERYHANLLAVMAKERELRRIGYQESTLQDEYRLERGEYFVRVPYPENTETLQGWESVTLFWRAS